MKDVRECILYEDKDILVCHKPAGIAVQSGRVGSMDLESLLKNYIAQKKNGKDTLSGCDPSIGSAGGRSASVCSESESGSGFKQTDDDGGDFQNLSGGDRCEKGKCTAKGKHRHKGRGKSADDMPHRLALQG